MLHTVVLNSNNHFLTPSANTNEITFNMDWSFLKDNTKYKIRFFFNSRGINSVTADSVYNVYTDFLYNANTAEPNNLGGYTPSLFLGMIHPETVINTGGGGGGGGGGNTAHLKAHSVDSAYILLNSKPNNSIFKIIIKNMDGSNPNITPADNTKNFLQYTTVLQFEEI